MPSVDDAFPSNYLKADDLQGKEIPVTISRVAMEPMANGETKPVVYFEGKEKGVVLNKTNATNIALAYGKEMNDWAGCRVVLFSVWTEFQGNSVQGIRIRPGSQAPQRQAGGMRPDPDAQAPIGDNPPPPESAPDLDDSIPF